MCSDVVVDGCEFFNFDYNACTFTRSVNTKLTNSTIRKSDGAGAAAVFVNNGTVGANITQCYISSATNGVVIGGTNGVSTYTNISDNVVYGVSQSPITATPLSDFTSINNNMVESSNLFVSFQDGISVNGFNASVTNNTIVGSHRYAISAQAKASFGSCSYVISNNQMRNIVSTASSDVGIYVANDSAGGSIIDSLIMSDNNIDGSPDIHMQVFSTGGNIKNVSITGNVTNDNATDTGILLKTAGAYTITDAIVRGNIVKAADTVPAIRLFGLTTSLISRVLICDNSVMGGLSGVQLDYTADVTMRNNTIMLNIPTGSGMFTQATTVVTVTTATAHGLVVGDYIDLTAPTVTTGGIIAGYRFVVLTVPTATTFTLGAGSATVATATAISWTKPRSKYAIDSNTVRCSLDRTDSMPVHILGTTTSAYPYKVFAEDDWVYSSCAVAVNILLPVATQFPGREIKFKTYSALAMNSLTSNIAEYNSQTANTNAIVPATAAWWAVIKSNGSVWQKINRGMQ
jgi:hypothetical protein